MQCSYTQAKCHIVLLLVKWHILREFHLCYTNALMSVRFKGDRLVHNKYIIITRTHFKMRKTKTKSESILHFKIVPIRVE